MSVKQSVCRWCFNEIPLAVLAREAARIGYLGMDLVEPAQWGVLKEHELICAMTPTHGNKVGLANPADHAECLAKIEAAIVATAAEGWPNVACFSGNRAAGISDDEGLEHCARALARVVPLAEAKGVTLCMELLNSKVNHPGYMANTVGWGAELVRRVGSPRFRLLFDIYHVEVQEGTVLEKIRGHREMIAHYHTAGVPGRHEIDAPPIQTLDYAAIMREIQASGFEGYVGQEFKPVGDPIRALERAFEICDV
jgi:hydroxypyruvate isomerase